MMGRVILVGNSVELLQHEYGSYIDSFDTIVRFGKGIPTDENFEQIGKKTNIWITGFLRQRHYHKFENVKILFNRCRIHMDTEPSTPKFTQPHEVMFTEDDARSTVELSDRYIIESSSIESPNYLSRDNAMPVSDSFRYSSDSNSHWLDAEGIRELIALSD